jgi:hypothetical protein
MDNSFKKISKSWKAPRHKTDYNKQKFHPRAFYNKKPCGITNSTRLNFKKSTTKNSVK